MKNEDQDKLEEWLSDVKWEEGYMGMEVNTPRDWLREAVKTALDECKRPMGKTHWPYDLAITMVPTYPEIVLDVHEYGEDDIEFTFDWDKFHEILNGALDTLINQKIESTE